MWSGWWCAAGIPWELILQDASSCSFLRGDVSSSRLVHCEPLAKKSHFGCLHSDIEHNIIPPLPILMVEQGGGEGWGCREHVGITGQGRDTATILP